MIDTSDPLIGQRLSSYRIERLIGRGGMASVYYGWDARLRRPAAIKVADAGQQDIAYAKRLVHEARMIARWRHEHVIQVYYAAQQGPLYFFAMEYVDGLDLSALMARYHQVGELIPHPDVIRVGRAVASALDYAHAQGVIHRDVKPSNVLLALNGRIVLSDFGLALEIQQGTMGEVLGTPHYVAPEQARDSASTVPQSDLYALGVILYEMLTGSVPFDDLSPMSLALKHMTEQPPLPTDLNPALGIPVEAVLLKALSKAPEDRYPSGEVMLDVLERALALGHDAVADERLRTPVADVLDEIAASRETLPKRSGESPQLVTTPAREKTSRRRRIKLIALGGLIVGVLTVIAIAIALFSGLIGRAASPAAGTGLVTSQTAASSLLPTVGEIASAEVSAASTELPVVPDAAAQPPAPTVLAVSPTLPPASPVVPQPSGYRLAMTYTEKGFYLINPGDRAVEVGSLAFEALDSATDSSAGYRFDVQTWLAAANYFPKLEPGKCDAIEIHLTSAFIQRPPECSDFNALVTPEQSSLELFWLARPNVAQFRVLWKSAEVARCAAGSGACDLLLPSQ